MDIPEAVPKKIDGSPDKRTKEYRRWKEKPNEIANLSKGKRYKHLQRLALLCKNRRAESTASK